MEKKTMVLWKKLWCYKKNKRPMGHITHLRNQFKSTNTFERSYNYKYYKISPVVNEEKFFISWMYFCKIVIISRCKKMWLFHLKKLKSSLPRDNFCQVWLKLAQLFWRRRFFKIVSVILLFCNYLPLEKERLFI